MNDVQRRGPGYRQYGAYGRYGYGENGRNGSDRGAMVASGSNPSARDEYAAGLGNGDGHSVEELSPSSPAPASGRLTG